MTLERKASGQVAEMPGRSALPRKSGEMVFHNDWERRAFAIAVSLAQQGYYQWPQFQQLLIDTIAAAEQDDPQHPTRGYYESWLISLEKILSDLGVGPR